MAGSRRLLMALLVLPLLACGSDPPTSKKQQPGTCTCEAMEDCQGCYEHIGDCCYGDATIFGKVALLAANCERDGACSTCCNECIAKSCDELVKANMCPIPPATQ